MRNGQTIGLRVGMHERDVDVVHLGAGRIAGIVLDEAQGRGIHLRHIDRPKEP